MIKKLMLVMLALGAIALSGCAMTVSKLSRHEIRAANGETRDVVWIARDGDTVYRCALYQNKPFCVKATFGKLP